MAALSSRRRRALSTLTGLLCRGIVDDGDAAELLALYATVFEAEGILIGQTHGFGAWFAQADIPPAWPARHSAFSEQDPSRDFLARAAEGTPFLIQRDAAPEAKRTALYHAMVGEGLHDAVVQRFRTVWSHDVHLAFYRPKGARAFDDDDATLAYLLHPHAAGAIAARSAGLALSAMAGVETRPADGHLHVGFPAMSVHWSQAGRRTWERELGPLRGLAWRRVERLVQRIARDFDRGAASARSRLVLPSLRAELAWVPAAPGESRRALVLFFREAAPGQADLTARIELLSPNQREVAALAARRFTNDEIAEELGMSFETVRSHLKAVFARLEIRGRADLTAAFERPGR